MDQHEGLAAGPTASGGSKEGCPVGRNNEHHRNCMEREDSLSPNDFQHSPPDWDRIVRHIMVIGFHHKHGYQVDFCYPPLNPAGPVFSTLTRPITLPDCWKTLPLLCLPDGSHNYDSDTIYFTMPDTVEHAQEGQASQRDSSEGIKTIFGTACYRQIQADKLRNRTDDMTRVAVQKSVCVLSTKPLFGLIRSKLEMITHAYFEELDFSKVKILKLTYDNLNSLLSRDSVKDNATFLGLSARHLVSQFGCNMLLLFKAMLLEKKILFYKSPVRDLCSTIMSMCSLFAGLLESGGLDYSTCDLHLSPTLLEALKLAPPASKVADEANGGQQPQQRNDKVFFSPSKEEVVIMSDFLSDTKQAELSETESSLEQHNESQLEQTGEYEVISDEEKPDQGQSSTSGQGGSNDDDNDGPQTLGDGSVVEDPHALKLCRSPAEDCGLPLQIFTRGSFCLPYLSISYLDLLSDVRVRSFVIGATNFLFKQRRGMYDVIVDMEENTIVVNDPDLKKCLSLSTEDLRFMDYLCRHVKVESASQPKDEFDLISQDVTKWVGGDEWIRYHFRLYTLYLLKASRISATNQHQLSVQESFNSQFLQTWKESTNNYRIWEATGKSVELDGLQLRHPFSSAAKGINFSDMKLKLSYAVNSSEKGRIINQTLNGIGKWSIWNNLASAAAAATSAGLQIPSATGASVSTDAGQVTQRGGCKSSASQQASPGAQDPADQPPG